MLITCLLFAILVFADQLLKWITQKEAFNNFVVIKFGNYNFLTFDYQLNKGMAWSLLSDSTWLLVIISLVASIVLGYFCMKNDWKNKKIKSIGLTLAFAGCFGNLIDRFICITPLKEYRGGVVDMISFGPLNSISQLISKTDFPIFNLADAFLVVGLILYAIYLLFLDGKDKNEKIKSSK